MREISFGQYLPTNSFVHKLDPRIKILLTIAFIVAVYLVKEFHFLGFLACFAFIVLVTAFSKISFFKVLRSMKAIIFIVVFSSVLQIFFVKTGNLVIDWWIFKITDQALLRAGFITARISLMVMGASLLTFTTSPVEISDGIESLLFPLKYIKFPVHEFALIMNIALRFIPSLLEETDRIIKAQKARGANFESGNIFKRIKALIPVLIPLLISSLRRADELADAMEARCYAGSKNRTRYKVLKPSYRDLIATVIVSGLIVGIVFLNKFYILLAV